MGAPGKSPQQPQPTMFLITTSNYKSSNVPCFFTMFFDVSGPDWPTPCFFDHVFHVSGPFLVRIGQHHVFLTMFFEQKALCDSCRGWVAVAATLYASIIQYPPPHLHVCLVCIQTCRNACKCYTLRSQRVAWDGRGVAMSLVWIVQHHVFWPCFLK